MLRFPHDLGIPKLGGPPSSSLGADTGESVLSAAARRVVVASDERLLRETLTTALVDGGFEAHELGSPEADECTVGVLLAGLETDESITCACAVLDRYDVPWVVVAHTPRGEGWRRLADAGAAVVLSSTCSIADVGSAIDSVMHGAR